MPKLERAGTASGAALTLQEAIAALLPETGSTVLEATVAANSNAPAPSGVTTT